MSFYLVTTFRPKRWTLYDAAGHSLGCYKRRAYLDRKIERLIEAGWRWVGDIAEEQTTDGR